VDITELREAQEQLIHAQKMEAVGHIAGGVAHDFNNLLQAISGFAHTLRSGKDGCRISSDHLAELDTLVQHGAQLTRQLLLFSRREPRQDEVLDLDEVLRQSQTLVLRVLRENIELDLQPSRERLNVFADRGRIEQVVMNLVVNAQDAMPEGGRLTIRSAPEDNDRVILEVEDTGCGVAPELRQKIFDPLFTTKEPGKGTGLGLSIVRRIVSEAGGTVTVDTGNRRGTVFRITLSRHAEPETDFATAERPDVEPVRSALNTNRSTCAASLTGSPSTGDDR
jgi:two-component system cell cycle sensor histidine kinase/response regulator CckA